MAFPVSHSQVSTERRQAMPQARADSQAATEEGGVLSYLMTHQPSRSL